MTVKSLREFIILCKNATCAKRLFDRYTDILDRFGTKMKTDKSRLIVMAKEDSVRFVSYVSYYNNIKDGRHDVTVIGDAEFDIVLDKFEERYLPKRKEII